MAKYAAALVAACVLLSAVAADRDLLATSVTESKGIPFNAAGGKGSADVPIVPPPSNGPDAEQIHITYVNGTAVTISWATGNATILNGVLPNNAAPGLATTTSGAASFPVSYGTASGKYDANATGFTATYNQIYTEFVNSTGFHTGNPTFNYSSPELHHVTLAGLKPNTTYFYTVAASSGSSAEYNFTTPPAVGSFPLLMGVFADIGQTYNSTTTLARMLGQNPQVLTLIGDWTYADDYNTNGTVEVDGFPNNTYGVPIASPAGTYQPRWDNWFRLAEPLLSHIPIIPNAGNHELEPLDGGLYFQNSKYGLDGGRQFNSYQARLPVPYQNSGGSPLYYSTDVGPVHMIILNNYDDFLPGSAQYNWLLADLSKVDRTVTPWIVAQWHAPWYSSYTTHYKETESMRVPMEPLFYAAGVDIVLNGHLHEYERTNSVYDYKVDACGAVHIIIGDGGNIEGLYTSFIDQPGNKSCPKPNTLPAYQPGPYTPSFTYNTSNPSKGYCPDAGTTSAGNQPAWSAFRQPAFGHGTLYFINETHAYWEWNRNLDEGTVYEDTVYIIRERSCPNFNGEPLTPAPAPSGAVSAASLG